MERYYDIMELLAAVEENIKTIERKYDDAKSDDELKSILRPQIKSCLEHLRSALEYSAQDIAKSIGHSSNKTYFPYGADEALFKANVKRNLPNLATISPGVFKIVAAMQPYICNDNWVIELCNQTNFNKHNKLGEQERVNSPQSTTNVGNLVQFNGGGAITFQNCSYNGMPLGVGSPVTISGDMSAKQIKSRVKIPIEVTKTFEWVEFRFKDSTTDTLSLIKTAHKKIHSYIDDLNTELTKT